MRLAGNLSEHESLEISVFVLFVAELDACLSYMLDWLHPRLPYA